MPHGEVSEVIEASSEAVFDLIHDYSRRLEWDTLLQAAYLDDGHKTVAAGTTSVCVGRRSLGGIALKTVYVSFERPRVAAVKMLNAPLFFDRWGASIRHEDLPGGRSRVTYTFQFSSRPRIFRFLLDPIMQLVFTWETRKRLHALKEFLER